MKTESEKRLETAISGPGAPDRVPVAPLLYYFAGVHAGLSCSELLNEPRKYRAAIEKCWEDFGPWDVYYPLNGINRDMVAVAMPMRTAYPGDELPDDEQAQFLEEEIMFPEDYDLLIEPISPPDRRELRLALALEMDGLAKDSDGPPENTLRAAAAAARDALSSLFRSEYGDPRDLKTELRSRAAFARTLARLVQDPEIDTDHFLRYLVFIMRMAARARRRESRISNAAAVLRAVLRQLDFTKYDIAAWRGRGAAALFGMGLEGPFDSFSMARSMLPFSTEDLFKRPEDIRRAALAATDFFTAMAELGTAVTGVPRFIYAAHRTSNDFISPAHFRDLAFPAMRAITESITARGITMIFHCDGKWDLNLEYLAKLPEGKCVFQFDGRTDMRLARRTLGPGHCIFGDVPAAMLAHGTENEVADYCRALIRDIGADGRFILGAGCEVPPDARPENLRAMLRTPVK